MYQPEKRSQIAERAAWIGIIANLLLAVLKGIVGFVANSRALLADAVNSASDVMGSIAVLIGLRIARQPPDEDHPYGHGKAESIAAIIVSVLLFVVGLEIGYSSFMAIFEPAVVPGIWAVYVLIFTIVLKEILFHYQNRLGKKLNSQALIANSWDHRADVLASSAALVGVGGSLLGARWEIPYLIYLDPVAGVAVSLFVLRTAYKMIDEAIHNTLDHVLHEEEASQLVEEVEKVDGVLRVDGLRAREHGHYVIVDVKISVDPRITVERGHAIGKNVKHCLMDKFAHVNDVLVHINPYGPEFPYPQKPKGNSDLIH
ncbi:MAG: cation transporter [Bacillaceae bacterium]|nr:cation transporter [Bacillaceae bacterium]